MNFFENCQRWPKDEIKQPKNGSLGKPRGKLQGEIEKEWNNGVEKGNLNTQLGDGSIPDPTYTRSSERKSKYGR